MFVFHSEDLVTRRTPQNRFIGRRGERPQFFFIKTVDFCVTPYEYKFVNVWQKCYQPRFENECGSFSSNQGWDRFINIKKQPVDNFHD